MKEVMIDYIEELEEIKNIRQKQSEEAINKYIEMFENGTSKPILVKEINRQKYILIDGHHRIEALKRLKKKKIDIEVLKIEDQEVYSKAVEANQEHGVALTKEEEEKILINLIEQGKTQKHIAQVFKVTREAISKRINRNPMLKEGQSTKINLSIVNEVLQDKPHKEVATIYNLSRSRVTQIWNDWLNRIKEQYNTGLSKEDIIKEQQENKINLSLDKLNEYIKEDYNKLINGDCLKEIPKLEDNSIDCVIIDPPYGIKYQSNFRKEKHELIEKDTEEGFKLLDNSLKLVFDKMKKDSHIYIFTSWKVIERVKPIISNYFTIKNCLVWNKNNWGMGDLKNYAEKYELIIFATKGKRSLYSETRPLNVIDCDRENTDKHPTRKPVNLIKELIINSTKEKELVLDYFAGSGSTLEAAKESKRKWVGIEVKKETNN